MERRDRAADMRNLRVWDGKHIEAKLKEIIPKLMEENEIKDAVEKVEKGIKAVSDETMKDGQRTLRGVVRVGPSAKGVLLASERQCHLVTLTQAPPTSTYPFTDLNPYSFLFTNRPLSTIFGRYCRKIGPTFG